jgi:hypothetical protein
VETHRAATATPFAQPTNRRLGYTLHNGNSQTPMVRIVPDAKWPRMWRMILPDGQISDLANLSRIKDAAADICDRGPPRRNRAYFKWKAEQPA